jgi:RND family efflux transporter MFP subunit
LAATGVLLVASTGCGGHGESPHATEQRTPLAVEVVAATTQDWSDGVEITASVQPLHRAMPSTVLMGRIDSIQRKEGQTVRKGQVLARVDSRDVSARVAQAEAAVAAARAMEHNARLMRERMERLHAREAATQKDLDDATAGYEAAVANLRAAEEGVKAAEVYLTYSEIKAPFDGVVTDRMIEVGDMAAPGRPLFVIENTSKVKIEGQVPESVASGLAVGDGVVVEIGDERFEAELSELLPAADPRSRTFTVRALLDNSERQLRSGIFARLTLGGESRPVVTAPESAIVRRGPLTGLFLVDDDSTARLRWATLGRTQDWHVEILTGLQAGERLVLSPPTELDDGRPVEVR